jgi:hypothetical protein
MSEVQTLAQTERECAVVSGRDVMMELPITSWLSVRDEIVERHGEAGVVMRLSLDAPHYLVRGVPVVPKGAVA